MRMKLWISLAIASSLTFGIAACSNSTTPTASVSEQTNSEQAEIDPCAANPCAANPCAANPCAANPCAANPCAANPCNPCAANPCAANPCAGDVSAVNFNLDGGVAIKGTDPVAYFTESSVVQGTSEYAYEWSGAVWHFSSAEHRDLFAANPEQYAPQYGGYCAWAVSQGYTAPIDPEAWKIVDGKLYLNYDKRIQARWEKDIPGNIAKANENWPNIQS